MILAISLIVAVGYLAINVLLWFLDYTKVSVCFECLVFGLYSAIRKDAQHHLALGVGFVDVLFGEC